MNKKESHRPAPEPSGACICHHKIKLDRAIEDRERMDRQLQEARQDRDKAEAKLKAGLQKAQKRIGLLEKAYEGEKTWHELLEKEKENHVCEVTPEMRDKWEAEKNE